jgi:hypothetical protein
MMAFAVTALADLWHTAFDTNTQLYALRKPIFDELRGRWANGYCSQEGHSVCSPVTFPPLSANALVNQCSMFDAGWCSPTSKMTVDLLDIAEKEGWLTDFHRNAVVDTAMYLNYDLTWAVYKQFQYRLW